MVELALRVRILYPIPHVRLHGVHSDQSVRMQGTPVVVVVSVTGKDSMK